MRCQQAQELLPAYALGALGPRERARLEAHLARCPRCAEEHRAAQETVASLALGVPQVRPPEGLKARLLARLALPPPARPWLLRWQPAVLVGTAVLILALLGIGLNLNVRLAQVHQRAQELALRLDRQELQTSQLQGVLTARLENLTAQADLLARQLATQRQQGERLQRLLLEQRTLVYMLATPGVRMALVQPSPQFPGVHGVLLHTPDGRTAVLVATGLTPLPPDKGYQVWLVKNGQRVSGGMFYPDEQGWGQVTIHTEASLVEYQRLGVTVEPAQGSPGPTGPRVLVVELRAP